MSKKFFAKKFVAYTMAFAVAFATINVSPIFVKDAQAAATVVPNTLGTNQIVANGKVIINDITSNLETPTVLTADNYESIVGFKPANVMESISVSKSTATSAAYAKSYDVSGAVATEDEGVIFNNVKASVNPMGNLERTIDSELVDDEDNNVKWFKLIPDTKKVTLTDVTKNPVATEVCDMEYWTLDSDAAAAFVDSQDSSLLKFSKVEEKHLGLYMAVPYAVADSITEADLANAKVYNLYEHSDLTVIPTQAEIITAEGKDVTLAMNVTSSRMSKLKYSWTCGGDEVSTAGDTYTLKNIKNSDFDSYKLTVNDGLTSVEGKVVVKEVGEQTKVGTIDYTTVVKAIVPDTDEKNPGELVGNKLTLTSSVAKQDDYVYVWFKNGTDTNAMSEEDIIAYDASNNSINITTTEDDDTYASVDCYVMYKSDYEELTNVANGLAGLLTATTPVTIHTAKTTLLANEETDITDIASIALYKETFELVATDDNTKISENMNVKVGDSLAIAGPTVTTTLEEGEAYAYNYPGNAYANTAVYDVDEFGTKTFTVSKGTFTKSDAYVDATTEYYYAINDTFINVGTFADAPAYTLAKSTIGDLYTSADVELLLTKFVNVMYVPDLTVTASDVIARVGEEIQLSATATSNLPVHEYVWTKDMMAANLQVDTTDGTKTKKFTVAPNDIFVPAYDEDESGEIDADELDHHYAILTVTNGIEEKTVVIKINQKGGFSFVGSDNKEYKVTDDYTTAPEPDANVFNVKGIDGKEVLLAPQVTALEDTELTYKWYKGASATGTVLATTESYTTKYEDGNIFWCVVADKDAPTTKVEFKYIVNDVTINTTTAELAKVPAQVYTGNAIEPEVKLVLKTGDTFAGALVKGTDYNVVFENNINVGTARFTVTLSKDLDPTGTVKFEGEFYIDRAENEIEIAAVEGSVQPKTVKNPAKAALTYTYYTDEACTNAVEGVPTKAGDYYVVATSDATANYNAGKSNVVKVTVAGEVKVGTVTDLKVTKRTTGTITVSYKAADNATGYRVYYKNANTNGKYVKFAQGAKLGCTANMKNADLIAGATTKIAVKAFTKVGDRVVWADKFVEVTTKTAPGTTSKVAVTTTKNTAKIAWNKVSGANGYRVYVKTSAGWKKIAQGNNLTYTYKNLKRNTTYTFAVRAFNTVDGKSVLADNYVTKSAKTK